MSACGQTRTRLIRSRVLELRGVELDGRALATDEFQVSPKELRLFGVPLPRHMTGKALHNGMPPGPAAPVKKEKRKEVSVPAS